MLEFDDGARRLLAHQFDGILIAEPIGTLDRVVEVIPPIVFAHVAEGCADAALRGDRVAARGKDLAQTRRR